MFGPMFIHQRKTFDLQLFLLSASWGETDASRHPVFWDRRGKGSGRSPMHPVQVCHHLCCFLHFRGNIESKLSELGISKANAREFIHDIFGNPALFEEGLVDAEAYSLDAEFEALKSVWNERERALSN